MAERVCENGHLVRIPGAQTCPHCGVDLTTATPVESSPASARNPGPWRSWGWVWLGVLTTITAALLVFLSSNVTLRSLGIVALCFGQVALLIGVIGVGVLNGMLDYRDASRSASDAQSPTR